MPLTDQEIIATWMEPKPGHSREYRPGHPWWKWNEALQEWMPNVNTLDSLHLVEERLMNRPMGSLGPFFEYKNRLSVATNGESWHADAETRIRCLAAVLRSEVEKC